MQISLECYEATIEEEFKLLIDQSLCDASWAGTRGLSYILKKHK